MSYREDFEELCAYIPLSSKANIIDIASNFEEIHNYSLPEFLCASYYLLALGEDPDYHVSDKLFM